MKIVILGLSITSSWGNGHASTYRALVRGLAARGHEVLFLERDTLWYADNRDLPRPPYCRVGLYADVDELGRQHASDIATADLTIVGSYVPDGIAVSDTVLRYATGCTAFYDIDTPVTLAALTGHGADYLALRQVPSFDLYLSFTGGPTLGVLEQRFKATRARPLYCSVDPDVHRQLETARPTYDLSYLGTYSADRQPTLARLLLTPAARWADGRYVVAGAQYPVSLQFPDNVERIVHLSPGEHPGFYSRSRFTLNVTRRDMILAGFSPSVRLFEAAACGTPIISDSWAGLGTFFLPGREILIADTAEEVLAHLRELDEDTRLGIGSRGRARVLAAHTAVHRAIELEGYVREANAGIRLSAADDGLMRTL